MSNDQLINLGGGYEGGFRSGSQLHDHAQAIHTTGKNQGSNSEAYLGRARGGFAHQVSNAGVATGDSLVANAAEHSGSANFVTRFVKGTAQGEQTAQDDMNAPLSAAQTVTGDIASMIRG